MNLLVNKVLILFVFMFLYEFAGWGFHRHVSEEVTIKLYSLKQFWGGGVQRKTCTLILQNKFIIFIVKKFDYICIRLMLKTYQFA